MNGLYSNFEKLGHKYGLTQLSLSYDTPKSAHDIFLGSIKFSFFGAGGPHNVGFQLSQKNHGPSFHPVLEINWADMEKDEKIIFGGGVKQTSGVIPRIRKECQSALGGYLPNLDTSDAIASLIQPPRLGADAGIRGAYMLGKALLG